jgi:hypothetical protein
MAGTEPPPRGRRDARGTAVGGGRSGPTWRPAWTAPGWVPPGWRLPPLNSARTLFAVAFLGAAALIAWGVVDRGDSQVPILVTGLLVLTLTFASLAIAGAITAYRAGRAGSTARAFWYALLGGLAIVAAWGCLAAAAVLALLYTPRG